MHPATEYTVLRIHHVYLSTMANMLHARHGLGSTTEKTWRYARIVALGGLLILRRVALIGHILLRYSKRELHFTWDTAYQVMMDTPHCSRSPDQYPSPMHSQVCRICFMHCVVVAFFTLRDVSGGFCYHTLLCDYLEMFRVAGFRLISPREKLSGSNYTDNSCTSWSCKCGYCR